MKIRPVAAEFFPANGQTETDMTKLIVAFRNLINAPKIDFYSFISIPINLPPILNSYAALKNLCSRYVTVKSKKPPVPSSLKTHLSSFTNKVIREKIDMYIYSENDGEHVRIFRGKGSAFWMLEVFHLCRIAAVLLFCYL
jgi:hypothetical protein